ncbi:MAG: DNA glycosylase [Candidatus Omnitrophica bacterium]|nr:DNA glycosylase [Candidatus Omnitrophota bacterium]
MRLFQVLKHKQFVIDAPDFNLTHTLECGQVFRWERIAKNEYEGVVNRAIIRLRQAENRLFVRSSDPSLNPSFIRQYLDLNLDLPCIYNKIGKDKYMKRAIKAFKGLRIIRQPLWECLASFIISAYNNIPRIKGIIHLISECSGSRIILDGSVDYSFPSPASIAASTADALQRCGAGYRAPYLKKAAKAFLKGEINAEALKKNPYPEAKEALMRLYGVGHKVADCVLLFSAGRFEAFPVDVWIERIIQDIYFNGKEIAHSEIRKFAEEYFGEYAGYAQQYLYHYGRLHAN